jgi:hypothetical protein
MKNIEVRAGKSRDFNKQTKCFPEKKMLGKEAHRRNAMPLLTRASSRSLFSTVNPARRMYSAVGVGVGVTYPYLWNRWCRILLWLFRSLKMVIINVYDANRFLCYIFSPTETKFGRSLNLKCEHKHDWMARYITIKKKGKAEVLTVCEVYAFKSKLRMQLSYLQEQRFSESAS